MENELKTKKCSICDEIKPLSEFGKNKSMKDGYRYECFECRRGKKVKVKTILEGFKKCGCCNEIKEISEFNFDKLTKTGMSSYCKICTGNKNKIKYRKTHILKLKEILLDGQKRCSKCKKIKLKNEFHFSKRKSDGLCCYCKKCKSESFNKDNRRKYINSWANEYNKKNPHKIAWRNVLKHSLERLGKTKEGKTIDLLGYSAIELKDHITALFTDGMSWDNYGEWHIDHIRPVSSFDKDIPPNIVNALSNLQPLWKTTREINGVTYIGNLNKSNK